LKRLHYFHPEKQLAEKNQWLDHLTDTLQKAYKLQLERKSNELKQLQTKLSYLSPSVHLNEAKEHLKQLVIRQNDTIEEHLTTKRQELNKLLDKLTILNPLQTIKRGYAVLYDRNQQIVHSVKQVQIKDTIDIKVTDGNIRATIEQIKRTDD